MGRYLDSICSLIPHLKWLRRVCHIFIERAVNQVLNPMVILGFAKLVDVRSPLDQTPSPQT